MMRRLKHTIWSKGALPLVPKEYRPLYQVLLPIVDAGLLAFSFFAVVVGSGVVDDFAAFPWIPLTWAGVLILGAVLAPIGLVFELDATELLGKGLLILGLTFYSVTLIFYIISGSDSSTLPFILSLLWAIALSFRGAQLIDQMGRKDAVKK